MFGISEGDVLKRLTFDNPWWQLKPDTEVKFRHPPKRVFFGAFAERVMEQGSGRVLALVGPRRVGKTVMMRQMVAQLIEGGRDPKSILYAALTTPSYTAATLADLFGLFMRHNAHDRKVGLTVFLDEAEYSKGWRDDLRDLCQRFPETRFVTALSAGAPGLINGEASDDGVFDILVLPPLTFLEFLRFRGSEETLFGGEAGSAIFREKSLPALNAEFVRYINFGGFPEGIISRSEGSPAPTFVRDNLIDRVLHKDMAGLMGIANSQDVNRLFGVLVVNTGREVSIEELSAITGIAKNTLRKYLDYLEHAFLIRRLMRIDRKGQHYERAVVFKVILTSPTFHTALFGPAAPDDAVFPNLVKTAIGAQFLGWRSAGDLYYAGWRGGSVDLVTLKSNPGKPGPGKPGSGKPGPGKPDLVFELDWADRYSQSGRGPEVLANFVEATGGTATPTILTRSIARPAMLRGVSISLVPASLYAYLLQRNRLAHRDKEAAER